MDHHSPAPSNGHDTATEEKESNQAAHVETGLTREHIEYLIQRHGTIELEPMPAHDAADPYNWPQWKVRSCLSLSPSTPLCLPLKLTRMPENRKSHSRCGPCAHGHFHRLRHHSSIWRHCQGPGHYHTGHLLPNLPTNRHPRRRPSVLEAPVQPIRPSSHLPHFAHRESYMQYWLC